MTETKTVPRLREKYDTEIAASLKEKFKLKNPHQIARLQKVVVNMGVGKAIENKKRLESAARDLGTITGQKPTIRNAKKSIAGFKLRENAAIGCMVTLRRQHMWELADRLISVALPRVRDFRGISPKAFDGRGNYTLGVREQIIFPEINYDKIDKIKGMNITFVTTAETDEQGRALLKSLGMPFRN